jgi:asparagine synthase (glutamine-hydrolysing)
VIILENNKGCKWYTRNNIYAKGYLFDDKNNLYRNQELIAYFQGAGESGNFLHKLKHANGLFSVIIKDGNKLLIAVDRARCFPLFYMLNNNNLFISDTIELLLKKTNVKEADQPASNIFLETGYVTYNKTLVKNIFQVQAGEYICFSGGKINKGFYHTFIPDRISDYSKNDLSKKLLKCIDTISERTGRLLEKKVAIIPLSGGYDSRLVASVLKNAGVSDVICFTYGRKDNNELRISEKVAKKLGYKWLFVEYNNKLINGYLESNIFREYYKYSANYSAMFFMQEYFAVKYLHENNLIPRNSVFLPGHSGDVLAGGHLWGDINEKTTLKCLAKLIYEKNYVLNRHPFHIRKDLINEIQKNITANNEFPFAVFQNWELKERHAKFIVNSANVYNFFGYEYYMPLWDLDLLDFFTVLPYKYRIFKNFYNDVLKNHIFNDAGLNFSYENIPSQKFIRLQLYKNKVKRYIPEILKKPFYHHPDPFFYKEITGYMINDLIKRGYKVNTRVQYENAYIVQWYLYKVMENLSHTASSQTKAQSPSPSIKT